MISANKFAKELIDFCYSSPTPYHAVDNVKQILDAHKFTKLEESDHWELVPNGRYYFTRNDSAIMAFVVGTGNLPETGFRIAASHTDSPGFRIKPNPEWVSKDCYLRLNTEAYGGPILSTWLDRPLSIAGRVTSRSTNVFQPQNMLFNLSRPVAIIPNMAIHLNRTINDGYVYNKQTDTLPFLGQVSNKFEANGLLQNVLAAELELAPDDILDFDLFIYEYEKGSLIGPNSEYISSSRIDNLQAVFSTIKGLCSSETKNATCVAACFDNEEVGSASRQGADSDILSNLLERISLSMNHDRNEHYRALANSFIISVDGAHAVHPNIKDKEDPTTRPVVNGGPTIKQSGHRTYTSDAITSAVFKQICEKAGVKYQCFVNRSDSKGGSTIGPISAGHVSIPSVDVGVPMLAMHSIRELCGVKDNHSMLLALAEFYN